MPWNGFASARWMPAGTDGLYIEGMLEWALEQDRINPAVERESDGYAVLNINAGLSLDRYLAGFEGVELRASLHNVFDEEYRLPTTPEDIRFAESPSNPLVEPGRNLRLTLSMDF